MVGSPAKMASNFWDKVFRLLAINVENILQNRTLAKTLTWKCLSRYNLS